MSRFSVLCCVLVLLKSVCTSSSVEAGALQWQAAVNGSAPSLWYQFEDTTGTTTPDSVGANLHPGTYFSGATSGSLSGTTRGVAGLVGNGVTFSGVETTGGYVRATSVPLGQDFTVEIIAKSETSPNWDAYGGLASTASGTAGFILHPNAGTNTTAAYLHMQDTGTLAPAQVYTEISVPSTVAQFHHYVLTYNESTHAVTFYIDGAATSAVVNSVFSNLGSLGLTLEVGHQVGQGFSDDRLPNITFDEFVLYDKALSAVEVQAHFASITAVPEPSSLSLIMVALPLCRLRRRGKGLPI